jgi:hypothetical protein
MLSRRSFLVSAAAVVAARRPLFAETPPSVLTVYKDPSCGCCVKWIEHMTKSGFVVTVRDVSNAVGSMDEIKKTMHVPAELQSCHTGIIDKYVIEGHVPGDVVKKFLAEKPAGALGLAVGGMPMGSPGMEVGNRADHYNVMLFDRAGKSRVYAKR